MRRLHRILERAISSLLLLLFPRYFLLFLVAFPLSFFPSSLFSCRFSPRCFSLVTFPTVPPFVPVPGQLSPPPFSGPVHCQLFRCPVNCCSPRSPVRSIAVSFILRSGLSLPSFVFPTPSSYYSYLHARFPPRRSPRSPVRPIAILPAPRSGLLQSSFPDPVHRRLLLFSNAVSLISLVTLITPITPIIA